MSGATPGALARSARSSRRTQRPGAGRVHARLRVPRRLPEPGVEDAGLAAAAGRRSTRGRGRTTASATSRASTPRWPSLTGVDPLTRGGARDVRRARAAAAARLRRALVRRRRSRWRSRSSRSSTATRWSTTRACGTRSSAAASTSTARRPRRRSRRPTQRDRVFNPLFDRMVGDGLAMQPTRAEVRAGARRADRPAAHGAVRRRAPATPSARATIVKGACAAVLAQRRRARCTEQGSGR